jgi:uncharacterized protein YukE
MLPSRPTLRGWNPDSLTTSAEAITSRARSVSDAVTGIDEECQRMPETRGWSGRAQKAASAMFGRASRQASTFSAYANSVASALRGGADAIGPARAALLSAADRLDAGPLNVTDQWVVLIDPVRMSAEDLAELEKLARSEQESINRMLMAVGDADSATANNVVAAGDEFGFVEAGPPTDLASMIVPVAQRPGDEVPDPRDPVGVVAQEAIRNGDMSVAVREVVESENSDGEEVTTVYMQDGSRQVITKRDPFDWPSRQNFITVEQLDKDGNEVSESSSWHDFGNDCDYTTVSWPDGSHWTMSMDPSGHRTAGFTTALGRHSAVPVELIDNISLVSGAGLSGLEKHVVNGGSLPMITASSIDDIGKAAKFGGPALGIATTVFDMAMADSGRDACIALVAGVAGGGGGWGGAELGAMAGATAVPIAWLTVPLGAAGGAILGGYYGAELGKVVGAVVCPY